MYSYSGFSDLDRFCLSVLFRNICAIFVEGPILSFIPDSNNESEVLVSEKREMDRSYFCCLIMLDRFNIVGKKDLFPAQLSGGQQQLVGVARALISKPKLLLADEPTGNLDSTSGEAIMELLLNLNKERGTTLIIVTHDPEIAALTERVINLHDGRVKQA